MRILLVLLVVLLVVGLSARESIIYWFWDILRPSESPRPGTYIRKVWAPVRVSTVWEEIEVWWMMQMSRLRRYYTGHYDE